MSAVGGTSNFDDAGNYRWNSHTAWLVSGNLLINVMDLGAIWMMITLWHHKRNPYLTIRRPGLLLFNVAFFFVFDFAWTMDNLTWEISGGMPCTYWEWAQSLFRVLFLEILILRAWVLFMAFNLTAVADVALKRTSVFEQPAGLRLRPENVIKLKKYKKVSKAKFLRRIICGLFIAHSIPFVIQWIAKPSLFNTPYTVSGKGCFNSPAYYINWSFQFILAIAALVLAWTLKLVQDSLHIKRELIFMSLYWIVYNILLFICKYLPNEDISSVWLWVIFDFIFYFLFLFKPLREVVPSFFTWTTSFATFQKDGMSQTASVARMSSKSVQSLKDLKQYRKASRMFRADVSTTEFLTLLHDADFFESFRKFLADELAAENLLFWKSVQDYRHLNQQLRTVETEQQRNEVLEHIKLTAKQLWDVYLCEDATLEINLPARLFQVYRDIPWETFDEFEEDLFDPAEKEIVSLMRINFFQRFRRTDQFQIGKKQAIVNEEETILYEVGRNKGLTRTTSLGITRTMSLAALEHKVNGSIPV